MNNEVVYHLLVDCSSPMMMVVDYCCSMVEVEVDWIVGMDCCWVGKEHGDVYHD